MKFKKSYFYMFVLLCVGMHLQGAADQNGALKQRRPRSYAGLFNWGGKPTTVAIADQIMTAMNLGRWATAKRLINEHEIPQADKDVFLRLAVRFGRLGLVQRLVDKGANPFGKDRKDKSAFDYANKPGYEEIKGFLQTKEVSQVA